MYMYMYKLSSTKIPAYLSQKEIQSRQKLKMLRMIPKRHWTLNSQKYCIYTKYLPLRLKCWSILLHDHWFSRHKVGENRKCTEWPQTELEHLTVNSTLYTLSTYPWGPNVGPFRLTKSCFQDTTYTEGWWKSEMHRMTPNWTWTLASQ